MLKNAKFEKFDNVEQGKNAQQNNGNEQPLTDGTVVIDSREEENLSGESKLVLDAYKYAMDDEPVIYLTGHAFQKDNIPLTEKVTKFYTEKYNSVVNHPELGEVKLDLEGVKASLGHGIGKEKAAAYAAVPQLIEKGKIFNRQTNWINRGYDTVVMSAPLGMNGIPYIGEVVVEQRPNR